MRGKMKSIKHIWLVALALAILGAACKPIEDMDISVEMVTTGTVFFDDQGYGQMTVRTVPEDLPTREGVWVVIVEPDGSPSVYCKFGDITSAGAGLWTIGVKATTENVTHTDVAVKMILNSKNSVSGAVHFRRLTMDITSVQVDKTYAKAEGNAFTATLATQTDFSALPVRLAHNGDRVEIDGQSFENGDILDLRKELNIRILCEDRHQDYTLTARNTGLPVISIDTPGSKPITSKEVWMEGATMTITTADGEEDYSGTLSIRGRGNSTWNYVKKPYALKLDKKAKLLGMPKHKRWVLLANWKDRTIMRNAATFWLSRQSGLGYTVRGQYVELVLNGKHLGNYYFCEQIKIDENRINITEMEPGETDPSKISGGYLMELDTYFDEVKQFKSPRFNLPFIFNQPDEEELSDAAYQWFYDYISDLEMLLKNEARVKAHEYEDYLDVDSAIDYMLVQELTCNNDFYNNWPWTGPHSVYMYKDRDGKLFHGPLWDFDYHTFVPDRVTFWAGANKTLYYPALLKDEKFRDRMIERWDLQKDEWKKLTDYIDSTADEIRISESLNHEMWPINTNSENGDEKMTFQQAVERMKDSFLKKWDWMDSHIRSLR